MVIQSRTGGHASAALRRRILHLTHLALSPSARSSVRRGTVTAGALRLLAAFPRTGGPLLVLTLDGRHIRAQETTLWMTRSALRKIPAMPLRQRPHRLLLEPVATDRIDLKGPPRAKPGQLRTLVGIYRNAGYQYGIDWRVLAAINRVETNFGHNTHVSSAGAVGWMQFLPSTWRRWGVDASGDGIADPYDPQDAIFSAARYLDAAGARTDIRRAIFAYNHADWYVNEVLSIAAAIPESYGSLERVDAGAFARRRPGRPQRVGMRVGREHLAAALLARAPRHALGPAVALAGELLETVVAELGGSRAARACA